MNIIIAEAIDNKKRLQVTYNGATRIVEPHAYGVDKKGELKLRAYQVSEDESTAEFEGWRLFREENMTDIAVLAESFSPNEGYNKDDKAFDDIIVQL